MKAYLDHIGIAVTDLPMSLAFFRDALGLELHGTEDVPSQGVRAHFVKTGHASLELLEPTSPDSPIAKYLTKRGPGLHHVTLRVDDIRAVLARLADRGVRLIDTQPRAGAEDALVAFIHPASTHGVLVEIKQAKTPTRRQSIHRYPLGNVDLVSLYDGPFRLDGGAMFGVVPKVLWERVAPADDANRIALTMRPLLIRDDSRTILVDAGLGDKETERFYGLYAADRTQTLDAALAEAGVSTDDIDLVVLTHLHFDHAGGLTVRDASGRVRPRFPRARHIIRQGEWDDATHTHERNRASYLAHNYVPLLEAGIVDFVQDDVSIAPGVRVQRTGGHTTHHQIVWIESGGSRAVFPADLMPTSAHLPDAWIMGYDLYPMQTLAAKRDFSREVASRETLILFEHDLSTPAGYIIERDGKRSLRPHS